MFDERYRQTNLNAGWDRMRQHVILYDDPSGETVVYATAYSDEDIKTQVFNCVDRHGRQAKVRSCLAEQHLPKEA